MEALTNVCQRAAKRCVEIEEVVLFGSLARGDAGARSDADLLVVLHHSPHRRRMDRIPDLLQAFSPAPMPLDLVPWTTAEVQSALADGDPWIRRVLSEGRRVYARLSELP